jgi:hypothetical protein
MRAAISLKALTQPEYLCDFQTAKDRKLHQIQHEGAADGANQHDAQ